MRGSQGLANAPPDRPSSTPFDVSLFLLRLVNGPIFIVHGWNKVIDLKAFEQSLVELGVPWPSILSPTVVLAELAGGWCLIWGLFCRIAALGHAAVMVGAILYVHIPWRYGLTGEQGMEYPLVLLVASIILIYAGGGGYSLDHLLMRKRLLSLPERAADAKQKHPFASLRWWLRIPFAALIILIRRP